MINYYDKMKSAAKKGFSESIHFTDMFNNLVSMFEYRNLPNTLRPEFIEGELITTGVCGVTEYNGQLYTGPGSYCGEVKNYLPTDFQITIVGEPDATIRGPVGEKFAVCWNNALRAPDWDLMQFSNILTEIDVSERINVLFARFMRIPKCKNAQEQKIIEDAIHSIMRGEQTAVVSRNYGDILGDSGQQDNFLDLVDIREIDKLQYLNQYHDNVIKRYWQKYGQGLQSTSKLAQQTTDELHGNDSISMIAPLQRLYYRKMFVDDINRLFGTDISVDFAEPWKLQKMENENAVNENGGENSAEKIPTDTGN